MAGGGGAPPASGGGGKKPIDFELNLVPFIDLMTAMISFLLITAVWTQVAKIDVKQSPNMPSEDSTPPPPDEEKLSLTVLIKSSGYTITKKGGTVIKEIETKGEDFDVVTLGETLKQVRAEHPENKDVQVTCEDKVAYEELIRVMDECLKNELTGISVAGVDT
jgi:biopolymer transport protein ExbD